jgi:hypothetical protein
MRSSKPGERSAEEKKLHLFRFLHGIRGAEQARCLRVALCSFLHF